MTGTRRQLLIVDDDASIRTLLRLIAERRGFSADVAADGVDALALMSEHNYDMAIIDLMMPRVNGYELVDSLRRLDHRPTVVIATAMTDSLIGLLDAELVHSIIRKPFDVEIVGSLMVAVIGSKVAEAQSSADVIDVVAPAKDTAEPQAC